MYLVSKIFYRKNWPNHHKNRIQGVRGDTRDAIRTVFETIQARHKDELAAKNVQIAEALAGSRITELEEEIARLRRDVEKSSTIERNWKAVQHHSRMLEQEVAQLKNTTISLKADIVKLSSVLAKTTNTREMVRAASSEIVGKLKFRHTDISLASYLLVIPDLIVEDRVSSSGLHTHVCQFMHSTGDTAERRAK